MEPYAERATNPTARRHPWWSVLGCLPLVVAAVVIGVEVSMFTDVLRVAILDPRLAYELGYTGEIGGRTDLHEPRGITFDLGMVLWFAALTLALIAFPVAVLTRRGLGDPRAIQFGLALAVLSGTVGFVWLSRDWAHLPAGDRGPAGTVVEHADAWFPILFLLVSFGLLRAWWVGAGEGSSEPPTVEGAAT